MTWSGWEDYAPPVPQKPTKRWRPERGTLDERVVTDEQPTKRGKYYAQPTTVDGIRFDSKKEADRYEQLKLEQAAGEITDLELQPIYELHVTRPDYVRVTIATWRGDFRYRRKGRVVVEDVKGVRTPLYKLKKKFVEAAYGVFIAET